MSQASQSAQAAKASEANVEEQLRVLREDLKGLTDAVSSLATHGSAAVRDGVRQKAYETADRARAAPARSATRPRKPTRRSTA